MGKHFGRNAIGSTQNIKAFGYQSNTDTSNTPARENIDDTRTWAVPSLRFTATLLPW